MPESTPESTSPIDAPLTPEEREAIRNAFADLCASREELTRMENLAFGPEIGLSFTDSLDRSQDRSADRSADRSVDREWGGSTRFPLDRWKRVTDLLERALQMLLRVALASMLVGSSFFLWRVVPHLISTRAVSVTTPQPQPKGEQG
jgi:hypothetical protein